MISQETLLPAPTHPLLKVKPLPGSFKFNFSLLFQECWGLTGHKGVTGWGSGQWGWWGLTWGRGSAGLSLSSCP